MKADEPPAVEVTWIDSCADPGWHERREAVERGTVALCYSVGYLLVRNTRRLVLAQSRQVDGDMWADTLTIPTRCVRRVRRLR